MLQHFANVLYLPVVVREREMFYCLEFDGELKSALYLSAVANSHRTIMAMKPPNSLTLKDDETILNAHTNTHTK